MQRLPKLLAICVLVGCGGSGESDDRSEPDDVANVEETSAEDSTASEASTDDAEVVDTAGDTSDAAVKDAPPPAPTTALLRPDKPMPCADPAVVSENDAGKVFYVYCTSMSHVWKTSDWVSFVDVRSSVTFTMTGMSDNGKSIGSWWAPGLVYSKALGEYVMWVSVPDAQGTNTPGEGWDTRSLAVFNSKSPDGPWVYRGLGIDAAKGQHFIDPFLFLDSDGGRYVYWKQYGGGVSSSIMGARADANWRTRVAGTTMEVMNGYGGEGTWEDNVRENPAVLRDAEGRYHMLFSGGHWFNNTYATAHALSSCGPLCPPATTGGWHMVNSGDRGILQTVRTFGMARFANGGPGGAVFIDDAGTRILYAAAAKSASGDKTRYLMLDRVKWKNRAPYVDTEGHNPLGY